MGVAALARMEKMSGLREAYSKQKYDEASTFPLQEPTASCTRQRSAGAASREGRGIELSVDLPLKDG